MAIETKDGLSLSDFGEIISTVLKADNSFSYALIRYEDGVCMIQSSQYYDLFNEGSVIPGTIKIVKDYIRTYEKDEHGNPKLDAAGKKILVQTDRTGWTVVTAKGLTLVKNESAIRAEARTMKIKENTAVINAQNAYHMALAQAAKYVLNEDQIKLIESRLQLDEEDENELEGAPEGGAGTDQQS